MEKGFLGGEEMRKIFVSALLLLSLPAISETKYCDSKLVSNIVETYFKSPQKLFNCEFEYQKNISLDDKEPGIFFQIYVKDLRQAQEAGIDLWKDQKCDFEYLDSRNVYTYTDSKFVGEKEIRRQLIIQLNRNDQIEKLSIRNFQVNPYLLKEKVLCSKTQSRRPYE